MVERRIELNRKYRKNTKMRKLKTKLATATGEAREKILYKIHRLSPWWTEASLKQAELAATGKVAEAAPKAAAPEKKKAAPAAAKKKA
jgi:uncharacterized membrane protein